MNDSYQPIYDAVLAKWGQPVVAPDEDALAQEIRRVDGNHNLGACALAEALMPFLRASHGQALAGAAPDERADFERWQTDVLCRSLDALTQGTECPGEYDDMDVQHEWTAWQARAVLAKWGTPAPVGVEPIGYLYCGGSYGDELADWEIVADQCQCDKLNEHHGALGKEAKLPLYTTPQPTQATSVPLTDEQIHAIYDEVARREPYAGAVTRRNIVRAIEAAHGIKGGTHAGDVD